jgi:tetratricopeptide (TPR) repeat protein
MCRLITSLLLALVFPTNIVALRCPQGRTSLLAKYRADESEYERLRVAGNDAVYNLDYGKAREAFERMTRLAPDQPAGYLYLANNLWLETLNRTRRLSSSLYSSASFFSQGTPEQNVDAERDSQFSALVKRTIEVAEARLKINPQDTQSLYYKGAAVGIRAAYRVTVKRSFWGAIGDAKESIRIQNRVVTLDPDFTDAKLSIGFYEYIVGSLPLWWRVLARFAGIEGSKKRGIELLEAVANSARYAPDDARVLLIGIYTRERKFEQAKALVDYLAGKYPRNYLLGIERGVMMFRLGRVGEGARAFEDLLTDAHIASEATDVVNYQHGEALIETRNYVSALARYKAVVAWPNSDRTLVTLAHLRAGQALDALGKRAEAVEEYKTVLCCKNPVAYDSHDLAKKYQRAPYVPSRK